MHEIHLYFRAAPIFLANSAGMLTASKCTKVAGMLTVAYMLRIASVTHVLRISSMLMAASIQILPLALQLYVFHRARSYTVASRAKSGKLLTR